MSIKDVIQAGIRYGYDICCINNYVNLLKLGYFPGVFMDAVLGHNHYVDHVLCPMCYEKYDKRFPHRNRAIREIFWGKGPAVDELFSEYENLITQ